MRQTSPSTIMRMVMEQTCQPEADSPPRMVCLAGLLVEVMRLRIELLGEVEDLRLRDLIGAEGKRLADVEVFEMEDVGHAFPHLSWPGEHSGIESTHAREGDPQSTGAVRIAAAARIRVSRDARAGMTRDAGNLRVEAEMQHVAVGDDILLAFQAELAGVARAGLAALFAM